MRRGGARETCAHTLAHTCAFATLEYSTVKRKGPLTRAAVWANLGHVMLSERSQSRKAMLCGLSLVRNIQNRQAQLKQNGGYRGLGAEGSGEQWGFILG